MGATTCSWNWFTSFRQYSCFGKTTILYVLLIQKQHYEKIYCRLTISKTNKLMVIDLMNIPFIKILMYKKQLRSKKNILAKFITRKYKILVENLKHTGSFVILNNKPSIMTNGWTNEITVSILIPLETANSIYERSNQNTRCAIRSAILLWRNF